MKFLLDTHIFLWLVSGDARLPEVAREAILEPEGELYLSVVSVWEATLKFSNGKLTLPEPPEVFFPAERVRNRIESLPIDENDIFALSGLPPIHRDPYDRLLIAQAIRHDLTIITVDRAMTTYPARFLRWI